MYQTGDTIKKTLDEIYRHDLVLPAIQREFVWRPEQICRLFVKGGEKTYQRGGAKPYH